MSVRNHIRSVDEKSRHFLSRDSSIYLAGGSIFSRFYQKPESISRTDVPILQKAWLTEVQAIAIYRAEIGILKKTAWTSKREKTLELCEEILKDEEEHQDWIRAILSTSFIEPFMSSFHRFAGFAVGVFLGLCPSRFSWLLHQWAELEAESTYLLAMQSIQDPQIKVRLLNAARQEQVHSLRFRALRDE